MGYFEWFLVGFLFFVLIYEFGFICYEIFEMVKNFCCKKKDNKGEISNKEKIVYMDLDDFGEEEEVLERELRKENGKKNLNFLDEGKKKTESEMVFLGKGKSKGRRKKPKVMYSMPYKELFQRGGNNFGKKKISKFRRQLD